MQARSPRSEAPQARLAAKEETRQAALALLASVNTPGPRGAWAAQQARGTLDQEWPLIGGASELFLCDVNAAL